MKDKKLKGKDKKIIFISSDDPTSVITTRLKK